MTWFWYLILIWNNKVRNRHWFSIWGRSFLNAEFGRTSIDFLIRSIFLTFLIDFYFSSTGSPLICHLYQTSSLCHYTPSILTCCLSWALDCFCVLCTPNSTNTSSVVLLTWLCHSIPTVCIIQASVSDCFLSNLSCTLLCASPMFKSTPQMSRCLAMHLLIYTLDGTQQKQKGKGRKATDSLRCYTSHSFCPMEYWCLQKFRKYTMESSIICSFNCFEQS